MSSYRYTSTGSDARRSRYSGSPTPLRAFTTGMGSTLLVVGLYTLLGFLGTVLAAYTGG